jgi:DHA2 family methylenomycin A resistance protein-like MFS transporter
VLNAARQTGATLGVAAMGGCLALPSGFAAAFTLAAIVCAAAATAFRGER